MSDYDIDARPNEIQKLLLDAIDEIASGDAARLARLISEGADPYYSASFGAVVMTPLQRAVAVGHNAWIDVYAQLGLDLNARNSLGGDAAVAAVSHKNMDALGLLRSHGAKLNESQCNGGGLMHLAVYHESEEIVRELHGWGFDVNERATDGSRPIHEAVRSLKMTQLLHELGANLKSANDLMETPAHLAADPTDGKADVFMYLMTSGSNVLMANEVGKSAADIAMGNPELVNAVRAHLAAREARISIESIEMSRAGNVPPPHTSPRFAGDGAIKRMAGLASWGEPAEIDKVIEEFGLEPFLEGPNPISEAARRGKSKMIHHLLGVGFDIDGLGSNDTTPLADAISFEEYGACVTLLDAGADPHTKKLNGKSALDVAREMPGSPAEPMILATLARRAALAASTELIEEQGASRPLVRGRPS